MKRYLFEQVKKDLEKKMVFIGGPRQVGKTTLAKEFGSKRGYLNWDNSLHREQILKKQFPETSVWIFDEIHKYKNWRNLLKGLYDVHKNERKILVTGSARLDLYRRGGDSLQGRYHFLRLHPITWDELRGGSQKDLLELLKLSGFPEPFLSSSYFEAKRWSREYRQRFFQEDILSIENIEDLGSAELLMLRLPELVGSPLSVNSLREDLQVTHKTVVRWLSLFENFYAIYRLTPFGSPQIKAVKKESKHYHFDWSLVKEKGPAFENFVAGHLLKWVHYYNDVQGRNLSLHFYRDYEQREVDFVVAEDSLPLCFVECKSSEAIVDKNLIFLRNRFPAVPSFQILLESKKDFVDERGIRLGPAVKILPELQEIIRFDSRSKSDFRYSL